MTQTPHVIVITSCTNRKKKASTVLEIKGADTAPSLSELARLWDLQVQSRSKSETHLAIDLYSGRSMTEAKRAAEGLLAPLYIVSAGYGLLCPDDYIPSYNVTASALADSKLHQCLVRLGKSPADWWQALIQTVGKHRSLTELVARFPDAIVLLAIPSAYLDLLSGELANLSADATARLRIITSPRGALALPVHLKATGMPYDERLEGLNGYAGTRSDFPQRALRHYVDILEGHSLPLEASRQRVSDAMAQLHKPVVPKRQRKTDEEIMALLRKNWTRFNGSASTLLRFLRDEALVACEQSRFRSLRQQLVTELNNQLDTHG